MLFDYEYMFPLGAPAVFGVCLGNLIETAPRSPVQSEVSDDGSQVIMKQEILSPVTIIDIQAYQYLQRMDGQYHAFSSSRQMSDDVMHTLPLMFHNSYDLRLVMGGYFSPNLIRVNGEQRTQTNPSLRVQTCTITTAILPNNVTCGSEEHYRQPRGRVTLQITAPPIDPSGKLLPGWNVKPVCPEDPNNFFYYIRYDNTNYKGNWRNYSRPIVSIPPDQLIPAYTPVPSHSANSHFPTVSLPDTPRCGSTIPNSTSYNKENSHPYDAYRVFLVQVSKNSEEKGQPHDNATNDTYGMFDITKNETRDWMLSRVIDPAIRDDDEGLYVSENEDQTSTFKAIDRKLLDWMLITLKEPEYVKSDEEMGQYTDDGALAIHEQETNARESQEFSQRYQSPRAESEVDDTTNYLGEHTLPNHYRPINPTPISHTSDDGISPTYSPEPNQTTILPGLPPITALTPFDTIPRVRVCHSVTQASDQFALHAFDAGPSESHIAAPLRIVEEYDGWYIAEDVRDWWKVQRRLKCVDGEYKKRVDVRPLKPGHIWCIDDILLVNDHDDATPGYTDPIFQPITFPSPERTVDPMDVSKIRSLQGRLVMSLQFCKHFSVTCIRETNGDPAIPFSPHEFYALPGSSNRDAIMNGTPTASSRAVIQGFTQRAHDARMLARNNDYLTQRMAEFEQEEGSERIEERYIPPNFRNIVQTAMGRGAQRFYVDGVMNFLWFTLQEYIPTDVSYFVDLQRVPALMLVAYAVRMAFLNIQSTIDTMGLTEDVEHLMMRPGHYYHMQVTTNPMLSEGEVNYISASIYLFKKFGLYQLTDLMEGLMLYPLPNPGIIRVMRMLGILNFGDNGNAVGSLDSERVKTELNLILDFHRRNLNKSFEEKYLAAFQFLKRRPVIFTCAMNAESIHPRRPNAVLNFEENFAEAFYNEYTELLDIRRRRGQSTNLDPQDISDSSDSEPILTPPDDIISTPRVADSV
jgi:hypothetical protein